jgi:hypothetical protein
MLAKAAFIRYGRGRRNRHEGRRNRPPLTDDGTVIRLAGIEAYLR